MNLIRFLLHASRGVVALAVLAGIGSGVCRGRADRLDQRGTGRGHPSTSAAAWGFIGLCAVAALTRVVAQASMVRLAHGSLSKIGVKLCRRVLDLPLRGFEAIDPASLLAVLTDDTVVLSNALIGIPQLCINGPIVVLCLAYIGWLSLPVLLCARGVAVPALVGYELLATRGMRSLKRGREGQDALVSHFRTLTAGFRELKLHRGSPRGVSPRRRRGRRFDSPRP